MGGPFPFAIACWTGWKMSLNEAMMPILTRFYSNDTEVQKVKVFDNSLRKWKPTRCLYFSVAFAVEYRGMRYNLKILQNRKCNKIAFLV